MSNASVVAENHARSQPGLRADLRRLTFRGRRRSDALIVDDISGRFARVSEHLWESLQRGDDDPQLWEEAHAAGWTRQRSGTSRRKFSPLFFRIPLGSIDWAASRLSHCSGVLFSTTAIVIWSFVIAIAATIAVSRSGEIMASLGSLRLFVEQSNPVGIFTIFVCTKVVHEMAHAVMCRRMGARCASVGLLMMCGIPCPYCDVTDIWRQPSATARAAVMFAGIYVELIIASLATFVWVAATDPAVSLAAMNLMIVCSISTLLFNANPLMRYDGYYVLSDLLGSTNLRRDASQAFRAVWTRRLAGAGYVVGIRSDRRAILLSVFHIASTLYRVIISIAIASFLVTVAEMMHLRAIVIAIIVVAALAVMRRLTMRLANVVRGGGRWSDVKFFRRGPVAAALVAVVMGILFIPMPRYRHASGWVDAADATSVFVSGRGMVDRVSADFGERVQQGEPLTHVRDETLQFESTRLAGQLRVARLRSRNSSQMALDRPEVADQLPTLEAAEKAMAMQLASVEKRVSELQVRAPIGGVLLPPAVSTPESESGEYLSLRNRVGSVTQQREAWCRVSPDGRLHAVLVLDARDRAAIVVGTQVFIRLSEAPEKVYASKVVSVSAIEEDVPSVTRQAAFQILCTLPSAPDHELLSWMGKKCRGVFHLSRRSLATDLADWLDGWFAG